MSAPFFQPIPQSELNGLVAVNTFAIISVLALFFVACRTAWLVFSPTLRNGLPSRESVFFRTQLGLYAACLLCSNVISSLSGLLGISWMADKGITNDSMCTAQAVMNQIATVASAWFTVTIAVHTFITLVLRRPQSFIICGTVIIMGWATSIAFATIPMNHRYSSGPLYGPAGLLCAIRDVYPKSDVSLHLIPIFVSSVLAAILYSVTFLVLRGTLVMRGGLKLNLNPEDRWSGRVGTLEEYHRFVSAIARTMLWYPVSYIVLLLPYSVTRLLAISGFNVSFGFQIFAFVCWFLLGLVNVLLLYNTFRVLGPAFDARSSPSSTRKDMESFGSTQALGPKRMTLNTPESLRISRSAYMNEKIQQYRNNPGPPPSYRSSRVVAHQRSFSASSEASSIRPLTMAYHKSNASVDSTVTPDSLQRSIYPVAELEQELVSAPEPAVKAPLRLQVDTYLQPALPGLSAAPRSSRSPVTRKPTLESIAPSPTRSVNGTWHNVDLRTPAPLVPKRSFQSTTSAERRSRPASVRMSAEASESTGWSARQGGSGARVPSMQPLLSAVATQTTFQRPESPEGGSSQSSYSTTPSPGSDDRQFMSPGASPGASVTADILKLVEPPRPAPRAALPGRPRVVMPRPSDAAAVRDGQRGVSHAPSSSVSQNYF